MKNTSSQPVLSAGALLGIGMGGFFDGILFHQILQLHNMLSNVLPKTSIVNIEVNMFWDGLFHAFTWLMTALGLALLWRAVRRPGTILSTRVLIGGLSSGWGLFNLIEGVIDHQILQLHHVYQNGDHMLWDLLFLGSGVVFILLGIALSKATEVKRISTASSVVRST